MRDLIVLTIVLGSAPICLFYPYLGVLIWCWIAYFNPQRLSWGVAYDFPVAQVIAIPTLVGAVFARKLNRPFFYREMVLLCLLWIWFIFTFYQATTVPAFAAHIPDGKIQLIRVSKILLMTLMAILLVTTQRKLKYLFLVTAFSFGFLALKGTIFGYQTGGQFRVWGPPESFIANNNDFALAVNMTLPMMFYLAREESSRTLRWILRAMFLCGIVSVILTYSRGGLLGLATVLAVIGIKSRQKFLSFFLLLVCAWLVLSFAPPQWMTRMSTLMAGELDRSAEGRINAWHFAWNLAKDYPITGGGFEAFDRDLFERYAPDPSFFQGSHSIYFQMLGEQGFVGLGMFLLLLASCMLSLRGLRKCAQREPQHEWIVSYSHAVEVGLLAFVVSGAFLGRAYFDLSYQLIAATIILRILYEREVVADRVREAQPLVVEMEETAAS